MASTNKKKSWRDKQKKKARSLKKKSKGLPASVQGKFRAMGWTRITKQRFLNALIGTGGISKVIE